MDNDQKDAILAASVADAAAISQKMKDNSEGGESAAENVNSLIDSTQFDQFVGIRWLRGTAGREERSR